MCMGYIGIAGILASIRSTMNELSLALLLYFFTPLESCHPTSSVPPRLLPLRHHYRCMDSFSHTASIALPACWSDSHTRRSLFVD